MSLNGIMILFYVTLQVPRQDIEILPHTAHVKVNHVRAGLPGFFCSRIPNFQQLDAKIKCEIPNFLWFLLAIRNKLSISVNLLYP